MNYPGTVEVQIIDDIEFEENEQDTRGDGEADCTLGYNKRERFHDTIWGWTLWDQVTNFGFERTPDGRYKCYQQGETWSEKQSEDQEHEQKTPHPVALKQGKATLKKNTGIVPDLEVNSLGDLCSCLF